MLPENLDFISYRGVRVRDVDHAGVHADIADDRDSLIFHVYFPDPVAKVAIQAVGISHWNHGDA